MKKILFLVCVLLLVGCVGKRVTPSLQSFASIKFDKISIKQLFKTYKKITGDELILEERGPTPWWVKKFESGKAKWMLLSVYPGYDIPDVSYVEAHIFDDNEKRIVRQSFSTGYRMFLNNADIIHINEIDQDVLVVTTTPSGPFIIRNGEKKPLLLEGIFTRQYYGFNGNDLVLIRFENDEKCLLSNGYRWSSTDIGPETPKLTMNQWLDRLSSKNTIDVLSVLVWLTGSHLSSKEERMTGVNQESLEDSILFESVRDNIRTEAILEELKKHDNV